MIAAVGALDHPVAARSTAYSGQLSYFLDTAGSVAGSLLPTGNVRDTVEVSDSTLSKQVSVLESAGYVHVKKGYVGKRPRTWLSLTPVGRERFARQLDTLRSIAESAVPAEGS